MESSPTLEYGIARTYMRPIHWMMGDCSYRAMVNSASKPLSDQTIVNVLQNLIAKQPQESNVGVPIHWLVAMWTAWSESFGGSPRYMSGLSRSVGRVWWHPGGMSPLRPQYWDQDCLYKRVTPLVIDRCKAHFEATGNYKIEERIEVALQTLADYLQDSVHCEIDVRRLDEKRFLFHIVHNTLASDDDENYRVFHGILEEFCRWLSAFVQVDDEASTYNKIIVVYSR